MTSDNPLPAACSSLLLVLPLVLAAGSLLASLAVADRSLRRIIAPGLGLALWLALICAFARARQAFVPGLVYGTLATASIGAAALATPRLLRRRHPIRTRSLLRALPVVLFVVAAAIVIVPATRGFFSDEVGPVGHIGGVSKLQNGHFPLRFTMFPQYEFRYHYGFDVFAAVLSALFRTNASDAIDLATLILWSYTAALAVHLARRVTASRRGIVPAAIMLFAGGLPFGCATARTFSEQVTNNCTVDGFPVNPGIGAYFFQHPFGLGIPLTLTILLVASDRRAANGGRYLAIGVLSVALFLAQFPLFLAVSASLLVAECFVGRRFVLRRCLWILATEGLVAIVATRLGGFFAHGPEGLGALLEPHLGIVETLSGTLAWHARTYGALLPLGLVGLFFLRRERLLFALLAIGALAVPNLFRYRLSWDIVKFATIAELVLAASAGALVARLFAPLPFVGIWRPLVARGLGLAFAASCVAAGLAFHAVLWLHIMPIRSSLLAQPHEATPSEIVARNFLRRHARAADLVYSRPRNAASYYQVGLNTPWLLEKEAFGFGPDLTEPRRRLLKHPPDDLAAFTEQGICWFVIERSDRAFRERGAGWLHDQKVDKVLELDDGTVILRAKRLPRL